MNHIHKETYNDAYGHQIFVEKFSYVRGNVVAEFSHGYHGFVDQMITAVNPADYKDEGKLYQKIQEIIQRHISDVRDTLGHMQADNKRIWATLKNGKFFELCRSIHDAKLQKTGEKEQEDQREKGARFSRFFDSMNTRMMHDFYIRENVFNSKAKYEPSRAEKAYHPIQMVDGRYTILDKQVSLQISLTLLLLTKPYSKVPKPDKRMLFDEWNRSNQLRAENLDSLLEGLSLVAHDGTPVGDYQLTLDGKTIYQKLGPIIAIQNPTAVSKLFRPLTRTEFKTIYHGKITKELIQRLVDENHILPKHQMELSQHIGSSFHEAINYQTNIYGNNKRIREISEEIESLGSRDSHLYETVKFLFSKDKWEDMWSSSGSEKTDWGAQISLMKNAYQDTPQTWVLIHQVLDYLSGELAIEGITISPDTAPLILKICKMADYASAQLNCLREKTKYSHSTYILRKTICEKWPDLETGEAFSRKIRFKGVSDLRPEEHTKDWCAGRTGEHAKAVANQHVKSITLSKTMSEIIGGRGNTGAGKSTGLGKDPGILNTDPIKWELRKGTGIRNKQVHREGAMIFDYYFDEMSKKTDFRYTMDLRLIDLESLNTYVLKPAQERGCPVKMEDFDVPLITSLNRVLTRKPRGEDPCPPADPIVSGFQGIRKNRPEIICHLMNEDLVDEFHLYHLGKEVAMKKDGELTIHNPELFEECIRQPTQEEIDATLDRKIDDAYIDEAIDRGDVYAHQRSQLEAWRGMKVSEAIEIQSSK